MKSELAYLAHRCSELDKYRVETCCIIGEFASPVELFIRSFVRFIGVARQSWQSCDVPPATASAEA